MKTVFNAQKSQNVPQNLLDQGEAQKSKREEECQQCNGREEHITSGRVMDF